MNLSGSNNPFCGKHHKPETIIKLKARKVSEETRIKMSKNHANVSGTNNPFYGKKHDLETRAKMSLAHRDITGSKNHRYGKGYTIVGNKNPNYGKGEAIRGEKNYWHRNSHLLKGEHNPNWKGGISKVPYPETFQSNKAIVRARDKSLCRLCYKDGRVVHHISQIKGNSEPDNLTTLCFHCHGKTHRRITSAYYMFSLSQILYYEHI